MRETPGRRRGRPRSALAVPAAERMRRYRARLRARGVRLRAAKRVDPLLARLRFGPASFLSPGEQDVIRRLCARLGRLPRLPRRIAVFGSRARGASHAHSDLDVAVVVGGRRDPAFEAALSAIALSAQRPYWLDGYGISLRAVAVYEDERDALLRAISGDMEVVWQRA